MKYEKKSKAMIKRSNRVAGFRINKRHVSDDAAHLEYETPASASELIMVHGSFIVLTFLYVLGRDILWLCTDTLYNIACSMQIQLASFNRVKVANKCIAIH